MRKKPMRVSALPYYTDGRRGCQEKLFPPGAFFCILGQGVQGPGNPPRILRKAVKRAPHTRRPSVTRSIFLPALSRFGFRQEAQDPDSLPRFGFHLEEYDPDLLSRLSFRPGVQGLIPLSRLSFCAGTQGSGCLSPAPCSPGCAGRLCSRSACAAERSEPCRTVSVRSRSG